MDRFGPLMVRTVHLSLHLDEPNRLYQGRDFAIGKTTLSDANGDRHKFLEHWVREGRSWYTRSTGFMTPTAALTTLPRKEVASSAQRQVMK